jgi:hypothetical protein
LRLKSVTVSSVNAKRRTQEMQPDALIDYRNSANEIQAATEKLAKLATSRAECAKELEAASALAAEAADQLVEGRKEGLELDDMVRRRDSLSAQLEAFDRKLASAGTLLQKRLSNDWEAWSRLGSAWAADVFRGEVGRLMIGIEVGPEVETWARALAEHSRLYRENVIAIPAISYAATRDLAAAPPSRWSSLVRDYTPEEWALVRAETVATLLSAGREFLPKAELLLARAAQLQDVPPFHLPAPEPVVTPAEVLSWNEALGSRSDREYIDELLKNSFRPRSWEECSPADKAMFLRMARERHGPFQDQLPIDPSIMVEPRPNVAIG